MSNGIYPDVKKVKEVRYWKYHVVTLQFVIQWPSWESQHDFHREGSRITQTAWIERDILARSSPTRGRVTKMDNIVRIRFENGNWSSSRNDRHSSKLRKLGCAPFAHVRYERQQDKLKSGEDRGNYLDNEHVLHRVYLSDSKSVPWINMCLSTNFNFPLR